MIRCKLLLILCTLTQINLGQSQWNGAYIDYGSYYVPYIPNAGSGPVTYAPASGTVNSYPTSYTSSYETRSPSYSSASASHSISSSYVNPSKETLAPPAHASSPSLASAHPSSYSSNTVYPTANIVPHYTDAYSQLPLESFPPPGHQQIYSNTPVSEQSLHEANALRAAYPNQPIIIINNGGNGDTGGNSNNGNDKDNGFNFGDLATILLATKHHHHGFEEHSEAPYYPEVPYQNTCTNCNNAEDSSKGCSKGSTVTSITIVLPSSSSVSVGDEKKKKKKKPKKVVDDDEDVELV